MCGIFIASAFALACEVQSDNSDELSTALAVLRVAGTAREPSASRPLEALHTIGERATPGDAPVLQVLLACVERERLQSPFRAEALRLSMRLARSGQVHNLVAVMRRLGEKLTATIAQRGLRPSMPPDYYVLAPLARIFAGEPLAPQPAPEAVAALMAEWVAADCEQWKLGVAGTAANRIASLDLPVERRRQLLLQCLGRSPNAALYGPALRLVEEPSSIPALRGILSAHLNATTPRFHRGAASMLAHLGDAQVRASLADYAAQHTSPDSFDRSLIAWHVWQINVQQPPSGLVAYIRSSDHAMNGRMWAIERALELNLDRAELVAALIEHGATHTNPSDQCWMAERPEIVEAALESGLMSQADTLMIAPADPYPAEVERIAARLGSSSAASQPFTARHLPQTHSSQVPVVLSSSRPWKPNKDNYRLFFDWYRAQDQQAWRVFSNTERTLRMKQKLCELDLLSPDECQLLPSSQPSTP